MSALAALPGSPVRAKPSTFPKGFWVARAISASTGLGLQLAGLYAASVTFGAWITVALYSVGGLAAVLQRSSRSPATPARPEAV